jgi:hypothetical protein
MFPRTLDLLNVNEKTPTVSKIVLLMLLLTWADIFRTIPQQRRLYSSLSPSVYAQMQRYVRIHNNEDHFVLALKTANGLVRFEVFRAVTMQNGVFWDVTPCGPCKNRRFGGT